MLLGKLLPLLCADSSPVLQHTSGLRLGIRLKQVLTLGMIVFSCKRLAPQKLAGAATSAAADSSAPLQD